MLIFQPIKKVYKKRARPTVAVLIDNSASMKNFGFKQVKKKIVSQVTKSARIKPLFFVFSDETKNITPLTEYEIESLKADGSRTDIVGALERIKTDFLGKELDGIILFSDGNQNIDTGITDEILNELTALKIPIFAVVPELQQIQKNISIGKIEIPDIIFRNVNATIVAKVNVVGFAGKKISVFLKSENGLLQTKTLDIKTDGLYDIPFEIIPEKAGMVSYSIEIPQYQAEQNITDNKKKFQLEVEAEKIRVLYLCGQPSFNYSFLRAALKSNPKIELVSFIILRNPENIVPVPDTELSLIPFPVDELFSKEIFNFDLLILDNFNYSKFPINFQHLTNIKNFVSLFGKAFLIFSGDVAMSIYQNTPLDEILPVHPSAQIIPDRFRLSILRPEHNILKFADDSSENSSILKSLPELDTINSCTSRDKTILLAESEKSKIPVIAITEAGKGRVMCVTTSSLWRLALGSENPYSYAKLVEQSLKWLTNATSMKQVAIITKKRYNTTDIANIKIKVNNEYFVPLNNATVSLSLTMPDNSKKSFFAIPDIEDGNYTTQLELNSAGKYKLDARAYHNKRFLGDDKITFAVSETSTESADIFINDQFMKQIATQTNGEFLVIDQFEISQLKIKPRTTDSDFLYDINIWNKPLTYIILILLVSLEWYLRRRSGLL